MLSGRSQRHDTPTICSLLFRHRRRVSFVNTISSKPKCSFPTVSRRTSTAFAVGRVPVLLVLLWAGTCHRRHHFYCAAVINPREDPTEPRCVNSHRNDFLCTTRPLNTALLHGRRRATDEDADDLVYDDFAYNYFFESHYRDYGTRQRVDGSDSEKEAVRQVMKEMEDYFLYEVFALDAYAGVRGRCKNAHELCAFWTSVGECDTNRGFMLENCAASCRLCLLLYTEYD